MITNETGYKNNLELIEKCERAIEQTRKETKNKALLNLKLEGLFDTLKTLKAEVRDYERRLLKKAS